MCLFAHYITISEHYFPLCLLLWPSMRGGAALKLLRLRHHLNFSLSWYLNVSLTSSSKHTLFVFWNTLWILIRMSKRKQPNLSQFGFTKQTKRSDDSAPATTSLPVIPPPPLKVAASDSTSTEDSETLAPETTAATCSGPGDHDHATPFNWTTKQWSEWRIIFCREFYWQQVSQQVAWTKPLLASLRGSEWTPFGAIWPSAFCIILD